MLNKLTQEQIKMEYFLNGSPSRKSHMVRPGYYWFIQIINIEEDAYLKSFKVAAFYHPFEPEFTSEFSVPAEIKALLNSQSRGTKEIIYKDILNAVIHVKSVELTKYMHNNEERGSYVADWDIIEYKYDNFIDLLPPYNGPISEETTTEDTVPIEEECFEEEENIDWESEEIFWEANQPEYHMSQEEIEHLLNIWEVQNTEYPE